MTKVRTVLAMRTREGCEERFEAEWLSAAEEIRTLDGCLHQDLVRDVDDPRSYLIISDWADRERLDAFGRSVHRDRLLQVVRELRESAQRNTYQVLHSVGTGTADDGGIEEVSVAEQPVPLPASQLYTEEYGTNPYPTFARLRQDRPVCPVSSARFDSYLITRFEDAKAALLDPRLSKDLYGPGQHYLRIFGPNSEGLNKNMLNSDPPEHSRLRRITSRAFAPRRIEALRPRVEQIVDGLLDKITPQGQSDLMADFAIPLPMTLISELLGIPATDHDRVLHWTQVIRTSGSSKRSPEVERAAVQEVQLLLHEYFADLVRAKRANLADDIISMLIETNDQDGQLSEAELVTTTFLLLFAGHQTTADFVGNAVVALLTNPGQLELLRATPDLLPAAIEELLRFDGPFPVASPRIAAEDVEYQGVRIPRGSIVGVAINAANHDPAQFAEPDQLDLGRERGPHIGFGHGVHYCLGVSLARMEAQIAIGAILRRLPGLELAVPADELRWLPAGSPFRGLLELPIRFTASTPDVTRTITQARSEQPTKDQHLFS